jgi:hypothetical protein
MKQHSFELLHKNVLVPAFRHNAEPLAVRVVEQGEQAFAEDG